LKSAGNFARNFAEAEILPMICDDLIEARDVFAAVPRGLSRDPRGTAAFNARTGALARSIS
jgi:hypothetical protein